MTGDGQVLPIDEGSKQVLAAMACALRPCQQELVESWCDAYFKSTIRCPGVGEREVTEVTSKFVELFLQHIPEGRFHEYFAGVTEVGTLCSRLGFPQANLILAIHLYEKITLPILMKKLPEGLEFERASVALDDLYHSAIALLVGTGYEKSLDEQRRLQQEKDEFVSSVCHELRNPLTVVNGYLRILEARLNLRNPSTAEALEVIGRQTRKLIRIANELVDVSRVESGRLQILKQETDLREVIDRSVRSLQASIKQHRITTEMLADFPTVQCDAVRIEQVMVNLLTNAIKYSPDGGEIVITLSLHGGIPLVSVRDQGIGISAEDLTNVFNRFYRAPRRPPGVDSVGLGLYICMGIVDAHGGRIWAESEPGKGSVFYFTLPVA